MSHEIMEYDSPVYRKKPAWHGLGVVIPEGDVWKMDPEHILTTAKMNFPVIKEPVYRRWVDDNGQEHYINAGEKAGFFMTVRGDLDGFNPHSYLGQVGDGYNSIQNADLRDFAIALSKNEPITFETAGTLRNGKLAWMLARRPQAIKVLDDKQYDYLLLSTTHDGTGAFVSSLTRIRVVCWNTLSAAINNECSPRYAIRHTDGAEMRISEARSALSASRKYGENLTNWLTSMAKQSVDKRFVEGFLSAVIPPNKEGKVTAQAKKTRERIADLIYGGQIGSDSDAVMKNGQPTAYGVYNAFTQWGETDRTIRCRTQADGEKRDVGEARMDTVMFGSFAKMRMDAFQAIGRNIGLTGEQPVWEVAQSAMAGSTSN